MLTAAAATGGHATPLTEEGWMVFRTLALVALGRETDADMDHLEPAVASGLLTSASMAVSESPPSPFDDHAWEKVWQAHQAPNTALGFVKAVTERAVRESFFALETVAVARTLVARFFGKLAARGVDGARQDFQRMRGIRNAGTPTRSVATPVSAGSSSGVPPPPYSLPHCIEQCFELAACAIEGFDPSTMRDGNASDTARRFVLYYLGYNLHVPTPYDTLQLFFHRVVPCSALREYTRLARLHLVTVDTDYPRWLQNPHFGFGSPFVIGILFILNGVIEVEPDAPEWLAGLRDEVGAAAHVSLKPTHESAAAEKRLRMRYAAIKEELHPIRGADNSRLVSVKAAPELPQYARQVNADDATVS